MTASLNHEEQAARAWSALTEHAANRSTLTYGKLGQLIGVHHRSLRHALHLIQNYCLEEKLPPITILVVQASRGRPGTGFIAWDVDDIATGLESVYSYPWPSARNPFVYAGPTITQSSLARRLVAQPDEAADIYSLVRVRGVAQTVFRLALLKAYGCACAFCGTTFTAALQAAHIVPWRDCSPQERLDPRNGLLLCATHHALFDAGVLLIDEKHHIHHHCSEDALLRYSKFDRQLTHELDGKPLQLPADARLHPDPVYISRRATSKATQQAAQRVPPFWVGNDHVDE